MTAGVTDEVWRQLDPDAGRLSRRTSRRLLVAALVAFALAVGGTALWRTGLIVSRVAWDDLAGFEASADRPTIMHSVNVKNSGWFPVTLLGAGRSGPGLRLDKVDGAFPMTLPAHTTVTFSVTYTVTDCAAIPSDSWPVPVRVDRFWGEETVYIDIPPMNLGFYPSAYGRTWSGEDPDALPWQRALANAFC